MRGESNPKPVEIVLIIFKLNAKKEKVRDQIRILFLFSI